MPGSLLAFSVLMKPPAIVLVPLYVAYVFATPERAPARAARARHGRVGLWRRWCWRIWRRSLSMRVRIRSTQFAWLYGRYALRVQRLSVQFGQRVQPVRRRRQPLLASRHDVIPNWTIGGIVVGLPQYLWGIALLRRRADPGRVALRAAPRAARAARSGDDPVARLFRSVDAHARAVRLQRRHARVPLIFLRAALPVRGDRSVADPARKPILFARLPGRDDDARCRRRSDESAAMAEPPGGAAQRRRSSSISGYVFLGPGQRRARSASTSRAQRKLRAAHGARVVCAARRRLRDAAARLVDRRRADRGRVLRDVRRLRASGREDLRRDLLRPRGRGVSFAQRDLRVHASAADQTGHHLFDDAVRRSARPRGYVDGLALSQPRGRRVDGFRHVSVRQAAVRLDAVRLDRGVFADRRRFPLRAVADRHAGNHGRVLYRADAVRVLPVLDRKPSPGRAGVDGRIAKAEAIAIGVGLAARCRVVGRVCCADSRRRRTSCSSCISAAASYAAVRLAAPRFLARQDRRRRMPTARPCRGKRS